MRTSRFAQFFGLFHFIGQFRIRSHRNVYFIDPKLRGRIPLDSRGADPVFRQFKSRNMRYGVVLLNCSEYLVKVYDIYEKEKCLMDKVKLGLEM